jgi:membrane protein required for colicin V production
MNVLDIILLILIIAAAISGFSKGFFVELASVLSIILGVWAAIAFSGIVQRWLSKMVDWSPTSIKLVAFIIIFIMVVIVVHLIANLFEKGIRAIALGIFSRLAGAVLGAIKGAFILSILILLITKIEYFTTTIIPSETKKESKLYTPIERFAPNIIPYLKNYKEPEPNQGGKTI